MSSKLLYAVASSAVISASSWGVSTAVLDHMPKGDFQAVAEKYAVAPGKMILETLEDKKPVKKLRTQSKKTLKEGKKKLDAAAETLDDALDAYDIPGAHRAKKMTKIYNVGAWTLIGFVLSLLLTLLLGISSIKTAISLGIKVTVAMFFLQATLVFAGILALQRLAG